MLIAVVGWIGSGKDTISRYFEQKENFVRDSFASSLKDVCASLFMWPRELLEGNTADSRIWREQVDAWWAEKLGIPEFTPRYALQHMGTEVMRESFNPDIWLLTMQKRFETVNAGKDVIISDCRFKNEVDFLRSLGGKIIMVDTGTRPSWYDTALIANLDDSPSARLAAERVMQTTYSHIHRSEWDWIGTVPDAVVMNDFETHSEQTYSELLARADRALNTLRVI